MKYVTHISLIIVCSFTLALPPSYCCYVPAWFYTGFAFLPQQSQQTSNTDTKSTSQQSPPPACCCCETQSLDPLDTVEEGDSTSSPKQDNEKSKPTNKTPPKPRPCSSCCCIEPDGLILRSADELHPELESGAIVAWVVSIPSHTQRLHRQHGPSRYSTPPLQILHCVWLC